MLIQFHKFKQEWLKSYIFSVASADVFTLTDLNGAENEIPLVNNEDLYSLDRSLQYCAGSSAADMQKNAKQVLTLNQAFLLKVTSH